MPPHSIGSARCRSAGFDPGKDVHAPPRPVCRSTCSMKSPAARIKHSRCARPASRSSSGPPVKGYEFSKDQYSVSPRRS